MRARSVMLGMLLASVVVGCSTSARKANEVIERQVRFTCTNGEEIEMRFFPQQGTAVLIRHGMPIELRQQPSGSGFIYAHGPSSVRGKGNELTVEIGGTPPLQCNAAGSANKSGASAR